MIKDALVEFSTAQAVTADAASEEYIDLLAAGDALDGSELYLVVKTIAAATSNNAASTLTISLQTDSDSGFATALATLYTSPAFTLTEMAANTELLKVKIPPGAMRYLRLYYDAGTADLTGGTFDAFVTPNVQVAV